MVSSAAKSADTLSLFVFTSSIETTHKAPGKVGEDDWASNISLDHAYGMAKGAKEKEERRKNSFTTLPVLAEKSVVDLFDSNKALKHVSLVRLLPGLE